MISKEKPLERNIYRGDYNINPKIRYNRFLCPNCNFITSRKGIPRTPIICPICGRLLTRITISSNLNY